jgi:chemotaxis protein MotB
MAKKKAHHEEHVDETWLIPYADMLTLLLALFIVMFAMGQVDKAKMQALSEKFNIIFAGGSGALEREFNAIPPLNELTNTNSFIEDEKMNKIKANLQEEIKKQGYSDKVKVVLNRESLMVTMQDVVLFRSGEADVIQEVSPLLLKISGMLKGLQNSINIVGHTDNVPIHNKNFRSNWDLSAMRAVNVMNFMVEKGGMRPEKFSIQAYGEYMPKYDNSTEEGRTGNRRVEIFIERMYPLQTK